MNQVELGTILHMEKGKKPQKQSKEIEDGFLPYVDIKAFEKGIIDSYASPEKCVLCDDGDLLIVCDGSRSGLTGRAIKGVVGSTLSKISADGLTAEYLRYFIQSKYTLLNTQKKGTGTPHLNAQILKQSKLIIPSLPEQERIVARIEELFSELDKAVETLKTTKQQLAVYRQAVLKEAFSGHETWDKYQFSDLMSEVRNGYGLKPDDSGEYRILKISAVRPLNLDLTESRLNKTKFSDENTIKENDILFTRYNGSREYVGICAVVPALTEPYAYPDKLIKCRPKDQNSFHSKFLAYYMSQGDARKYLRSKIKTTSGQNGIAGADIKKTIVYLPNTEVQFKIVAEIETKLSVCDSIEKTVDTALQQAEAMRQSILKQAFEGRL